MLGRRKKGGPVLCCSVYGSISGESFGSATFVPLYLVTAVSTRVEDFEPKQRKTGCLRHSVRSSVRETGGTGSGRLAEPCCGIPVRPMHSARAGGHDGRLLCDIGFLCVGQYSGDAVCIVAPSRAHANANRQ